MIASTPPSTFRVFGPGERCIDSVAGDLFLVQHMSVFAKVIRFFERLRKPRKMPRKQWVQYCWTNHAAIGITGGPNAVVSEEAAKGDVLSPLSNWDSATYAVVNVEMEDIQRQDVITFAHLAVGGGYGYLSVVADLFNAALGLELALSWGDRMCCSTQACRSLERTSFIPSHAPDAVTPAHLARAFNVTL